MFRRFLNWFRSLWDDDFARMILINSVLGRTAKNNPKQKARLLASMDKIREIDIIPLSRQQVIKKMMEKVDPLDRPTIAALLNKALPGWSTSMKKITEQDIFRLGKILNRIDEVLLLAN